MAAEVVAVAEVAAEVVAVGVVAVEAEVAAMGLR